MKSQSFAFFLKNSRSLCILPLMAMAVFSIGHFLFNNYASSIEYFIDLSRTTFLIEGCVYHILMALCAYWLCNRFINRVGKSLRANAYVQMHHTLGIVLPFLAATVKTLIFLSIFNLVTRQHLPSNFVFILNKFTSVLIICAISWILFKLIDVAEQLLLHHYTALTNTVARRKIYTQTLILKRVAYAILSIVTAGSILIMFDSVRALGTSVLTTAGVFGLVLTFTAQRSLSSIFSGLEIALTQPIKIGDLVVIENETGTIEEINFRSVVIKLQDWRRLIVPTNYFLEKPFQNWSRVQDSNLIGKAFLYVDFSLPVAEIRNKMHAILENSPLWDENVAILKVSDLQERVMQLEILASARNTDDLTNLTALLREELIDYIVKKHPYALPKTRSYSAKSDLEQGIHNKETSFEKALI